MKKINIYLGNLMQTIEILKKKTNNEVVEVKNPKKK